MKGVCMMTQKRFAPARLIPFLCLLLLPLGAIALGIMLLTVNTLFNAAFAVTFVVLPLCFILLLWPIWMTGKPKAWLRVLLSMVLSVVFLLSVLFMIETTAFFRQYHIYQFIVVFIQ